MAITEQHCLIRHQPEGAKRPQTFAVVRFKRADEMFWSCRFVVCEGARSEAAAVFARHKLKGEKEQLFKEVLSGLDLHHPPRADLNANRMFYAVAAPTYNLMAALKLLHLPDAGQGWQLRTPLRQLMFLPAQLVNHARVLVARVQMPEAWLVWWRQLMARLWPLPQAGRPAGQRVGPGLIHDAAPPDGEGGTVPAQDKKHHRRAASFQPKRSRRSTTSPAQCFQKMNLPPSTAKTQFIKRAQSLAKDSGDIRQPSVLACASVQNRLKAGTKK